jgi:hypothetical protein
MSSYSEEMASRGKGQPSSAGVATRLTIGELANVAIAVLLSIVGLNIAARLVAPSDTIEPRDLKVAFDESYDRDVATYEALQDIGERVSYLVRNAVAEQAASGGATGETGADGVVGTTPTTTIEPTLRPDGDLAEWVRRSLGEHDATITFEGSDQPKGLKDWRTWIFALVGVGLAVIVKVVATFLERRSDSRQITTRGSNASTSQIRGKTTVVPQVFHRPRSEAEAANLAADLFRQLAATYPGEIKGVIVEGTDPHLILTTRSPQCSYRALAWLAAHFKGERVDRLDGNIHVSLFGNSEPLIVATTPAPSL